MLQACKCKSEFQDKEHGKGIRVHTQSKDSIARCTVCGPVARSVERLNLHAKNSHQASTRLVLHSKALAIVLSMGNIALIIGVNEMSLKIGDKVLIYRKVSKAKGWEDVWVKEMDSTIEEIGTIVRFSNLGIGVYLNNRFNWNYPRCALKLIKGK